ncbi:cupin domain-containing protein [Sphingomonas sp. BT-65]|uniref:cupin domain-containing protein n=1 Tax=Sphingomonas sp. BT-65 TaxID=2989821 RepID=UPI002236AEA5|nr:cupin domain-containing protein [Sphingomonas sp. BT-65]MCW4462631.1 cupin domain-containing protein [Sphingomonas sp. BT-65]
MPVREPIDLAAEARSDTYNNHPVADVNDHVVRISTMFEPFYWHVHPDSDESFLSLEGGLRIEFADHVVELAPGQLYTVPRGVPHRTAPVGDRSVNLTFEHRDAGMVRVDAPGT